MWELFCILIVYNSFENVKSFFISMLHYYLLKTKVRRFHVFIFRQLLYWMVRVCANYPFVVTTHAKISYLVASLEQIVKKLSSHCLSQVVNQLLTTCNNLVDIIRLNLLYGVVPTSPTQSWYNNIVTTLCRQPCNVLVISWLYQTC
jgi:hypothetical protein